MTPRVLTLALVLCGTVTGSVAAQESRSSAASEPIPMTLELQLIDRTGMIEANPQHATPSPDAYLQHLIANAEVELRSYTPEAEEEVTLGRTDAEGKVTLELGIRMPGSPYQLRAVAPDGRGYIAKTQSLEASAAQLTLYRIGTDHSPVEQMVMRIVTTVNPEDPEDGRVQVRQIISFQNNGFSVYAGPPDAAGVGFFFPVPRGATVLEVRVGSDAILDPTPRDVPHWGYGVPIEIPIFPLESGFLIGVYQVEAEKGETLDLGFEAVVDTRGLQLALETGKFTYDESLGEEGATPLQLSDARSLPDVGREVTVYASGPIRAHNTLSVPVRVGPPGLDLGAVLMTLLILGCFAVPLVGGLMLARRRAAPSGGVEKGAKLRALHAAGELTDADLAHELARIGETPGTAGAAPPSPVAPTPSVPAEGIIPREVLDRLEQISGGTGADPETVARDVRTLARILRDHFGEKTR